MRNRPLFMLVGPFGSEQLLGSRDITSRAGTGEAPCLRNRVRRVLVKCVCHDVRSAKLRALADLKFGFVMAVPMCVL